MDRLVIVGASGHGKVVADIALLCGYKEIVFVDDDESIIECAGYPVVDKSHNAPDGDLFVAIGNSKYRKLLMEYYKCRKQPILIHPSSIISKDVMIQEGTVIMAGVVVNPSVIIGKGCIINTASSIDHDCVIGDYSHVSVGSHISGTVDVGNEVWIGAGATVSNNINICSNVMIGAGAVVIKDIKESGIYIGVPAKMHKSYS